jgi:hypothetical protein
MKPLFSRTPLTLQLLSGLVLFGITPRASAQEGESETAYFPLRKGTCWFYSAEVEWTVPDTAGEVRRSNVTLKSEVTDTFVKGNITAARVRGFVYDLSWYEPNNGPGDYVIVRVGVNRYYLIGNDAEAFWKKLIASDGESYLEELGEDTVLLEVPLTKGALFGESAQTPRGWYCWSVTSERNISLSSVGGAPAISSPIEFIIQFRTNPDHTILKFVPGVGITGYEYHHHGTVSNCRAVLIRFQSR